MLLQYTCTFLCIDAAGWTAIFTALLVVVTLGLWINASRQLSRQQRNFALANRPQLHIPEARLSFFQENPCVIFTVENSGKTNAFNLRITSQLIVNNIEFPHPPPTFAAEFVAGDKIAIAPGFRTNDFGSIINGSVPISLRIEFQYEDMDKKDCKFEYLCTYDKESPLFRIERTLHLKN